MATMMWRMVILFEMDLFVDVSINTNAQISFHLHFCQVIDLVRVYIKVIRYLIRFNENITAHLFRPPCWNLSLSCPREKSGALERLVGHWSFSHMGSPSTCEQNPSSSFNIRGLEERKKFPLRAKKPIKLISRSFRGQGFNSLWFKSGQSDRDHHYHDFEWVVTVVVVVVVVVVLNVQVKSEARKTRPAYLSFIHVHP